MLGSQAAWVAGLVSSLITVAALAGSLLVPTLGRRLRPSTILLATSSAGVVAALGLGMTSSFVAGVALLATLSLVFGVSGPVKQAALHRVTPSAHRATVISCDSLLGNAGGMLGQVGLGAIARSQGIGAAYIAGGLLSGVALPLLAMLRRSGGEVDRRGQIVGEPLGDSVLQRGTLPGGPPT